MKTFEEIKQNLKEHFDLVTVKYKVKSIAVFGSYVRGEQNEGSDVDILVEFKGPIGFFKFIELEDYLSNILGLDVDLVTKKALKPRIGKHILEEAVFL